MARRDGPDSQLYIAQASKDRSFGSIEALYSVSWLLENDVKIINMSYGSTQRLTTPEELAAAGQRYQYELQSLREIVDAEALAVISTGNENTSTPSPQALLPVIYSDEPELQKGILAVTGFIDENVYSKPNQPDELYLFDACGGAAAYCMSALGTAKYPSQGDTTDGEWTTQNAYGTSFPRRG